MLILSFSLLGRLILFTIKIPKRGQWIRFPNLTRPPPQKSITDTIVYNNINKYTWISIPLRFGYRFDINKFSITPRVGLDFSFVSGTNLGTYVEQYNQGLVQKSPSQFVLSMHYSLRSDVILRGGMYL